MSRYNGTFKYKQLGELTKGTDGFFTASPDGGWLPGCECQIDKQIPARQKIGTDGQMHAYTYDVFIPKHFNGTLELNANVQISCEDGSSDEFIIQGIDNLNRKYIELWG